MADPKFPITEAQITGNFCETLTYGIYLVTCGFCARTLLLTGREERWRRAHEVRWLMLAVFVALFFIGSFDVAIGLYHNIHAFVQYTGPGGAAQSLTDISDWVNIARSVNQVVAMVIGDYVLIYRCYVVYAHRWRVIVPSGILYLGGLAMAIKLVYVEASLNHAAITLNSNEIHPWWDAFFAITMVQNVLTTSLLVWRIWKVESESARFRAPAPSVTTVNSQPHLRRAIRVIAESGAAYTTMVFMTFVVSICSSNALYPLSDATLQATGITFNVIIVRSTRRRDEQFTVFDANERLTLHGSDYPSSSTAGSGAQRPFNLRSMQFSDQSQGSKGSTVVENIEVRFKTEYATDREPSVVDVKRSEDSAACRAV